MILNIFSNTFIGYILGNSKLISSNYQLSEKIVNDYTVYFEIINIFGKPIIGLFYDKFGFKTTIIVFNSIQITFVVLCYTFIHNSYVYGLIVGISSLLMGGYYIVFTAAAKEIY